VSANNPSAVFSVVRDALRADDNDQSLAATGATCADFHETVELVDPHGHGCVNPGSINIRTMDVMHELSGGGRDRFQRVHPYKISVPCTGLSGAAQASLRRMMLNRDLVLFSPDFGEHTSMAWYAGLQDADLMGNDLTNTGNGTNDFMSHVWDDMMETPVMRRFSDSRRLVATPFGGGMVGERAHENESNPYSCYPLSATADASGAGWTKSSNLTFELVTDGFGDKYCSNSLRVTGAPTTADRYMIMDIAPGVGADDRICFSFFMRGQVPSGASVYIRDYEGGTNNIVERIYFDDAGYDFSDWQCVRITAQKSWVFDGSNLPDVVLALRSDGTAEACDFEVAAYTTVCRSESYPQCWPNWVYPGLWTRTADTVTIDSYYPYPFTLNYSFYVPPWFKSYEGNLQTRYFICGMLQVNAATNTAKLNISRGTEEGELYVSFPHFYDGDYRTLNGYFPFTPGAAHVIQVVCGCNEQALYVDGNLIEGVTDAAGQGCNIPEAEIEICREAYGSWPLVPLAVRVDAKLMSADEIADTAVNMTNTGALEVRVPARGRKFRVTAIPTRPSASYGEFAFDGMLELEQFEYDEDLADYTCKEAT